MKSLLILACAWGLGAAALVGCASDTSKSDRSAQNNVDRSEPIPAADVYVPEGSRDEIRRDNSY